MANALSLGIHKKVLLVVSSANWLSSKTGRQQPTEPTVARWKPLFSESGYIIVIPRTGKSVKMGLDEFAERSQRGGHHYRFERTTLNHYSNFEAGLDNKVFADNQVYHDVESFTITGQPIPVRESFVKQPLVEKPVSDFWQIYTLTLRER